MFVPLPLNSHVSCLVSPEHPSHLATRGSCAGICEETNANGSIFGCDTNAREWGRGLCSVSHVTNPGRGSSGTQLTGSCFAGAVWTKPGWGDLREHLYPHPKNGTCHCSPRKHNQDPHSTEQLPWAVRDRSPSRVASRPPCPRTEHQPLRRCQRKVRKAH